MRLTVQFIIVLLFMSFIRVRAEKHNSVLLGYQTLQEKEANDQKDTTEFFPVMEKYPARGMLYSLVIPGMGQFYTSKKIAGYSFIGMEIASWITWYKYNNDGRTQRSQFQDYADAHWDLYRWFEQTPSLSFQYTDVIIDGTHHLDIKLSDGTVINSDTLSDGWIEGAEAIRDLEFYENVGKYNQFVAGWDDLYDIEGEPNWEEIKKKTGNKDEILVMTQRRDRYLSMRANHNRYLKIATYSVSAMLVNHLFSGIHAAWVIHKNNIKSQKFETTTNLFYSPYSSSGIGGVIVSVSW